MAGITKTRNLLAALVLACFSAQSGAHDVPGVDPPNAYCQMDAIITAGATPRVGDYLEIGGFTYAQNSLYGRTFSVVYDTRLKPSCLSGSIPGPAVATYAIAVGSVYEITSVDGSLLTLCRCD